MPRLKEYSDEEAKKHKNTRDRERRKKKNETMTDAQKAAQREGWARRKKSTMTRNHMNHINFVLKRDGQITNAQLQIVKNTRHAAARNRST